MVRSLFVLPAVALAIAAAGCGSSTATPAPTTPPVQLTETFFGTITTNGAVTTPFVANKSGEVDVQVVSLTPEDTPKVGIQLGTWNGTACALGIVRTDVGVSATVIGNATAAGTLCVTVFDSGFVLQPTDYAVQVTHF
jgi:hypothetical protein